MIGLTGLLGELNTAVCWTWYANIEAMQYNGGFYCSSKFSKSISCSDRVDVQGTVMSADWFEYCGGELSLSQYRTLEDSLEIIPPPFF